MLGANDRVQIAIAGVGGRGRDHINSFASLPEARIVALCDVNKAALDQGAAYTRERTGVKPKLYADLRSLLADKDVDVVALATPNHWHALGAIWACQAGKDVYVEKPVSHNIQEGRRIVQAARRYGRIVQAGSQSRTAGHIREAMELLHQGAIGKVHLAKGLCYKRRKSIGRTPDSPVPTGLDWDMFRGPAPLRPFNQARYKYNWHWFWDTGNGDIGNQGAHEMDIARWGLNRPAWPRSVVCTGGKFLYDDDQETPNMQLASFDYGDCQLVFEVRGLITGGEHDIEPDGPNIIGNLFYGSDGCMAVDYTGFRLFRGEKRELAKQAERTENGRLWTASHMRNFLKAVRSRRTGDLTADIEVGAASADLSHLANISYRVGRKLTLSAPGAIAGDSEASALLTREYRTPFVLPEKV
jgi:predicted dehydrogenase